MNKYVLTVMVPSSVKDETKDKFIEKIEKTVKAMEGKVSRTMEMGKKQMAYKVGNHSEAVFLDFAVEMPNSAVLQLEKKLTVDKEILRHLLVKAE